jgi:pimeloyl-ACP methyl ester carboxylesterase
MDAAFASGVMFMTICKEENPMPSVTSKDDTKIAFDRVGSGPAVILVSGATAYRAFDPSMGQLAELLGQHFTVYNYDRRGRGASSDTRPFAKEREIEDLQALVEDAGGKAMLFGISSGAVVSLDATAVTPGITRADALANVLPHASRHTLPGQTHMVDPNVLAPVLIEFFQE